MKGKNIMLTACLLLQAVSLAAQNESTVSKAKTVFHSINNIGLLEGEGGSSLQLQTINGFGYKGWFAGIGAGLDYYSVRSIPLFLDVRKALLSKKVPLFVYADAGIHFPWKKNTGADFTAMNDEYGNGLYYDAGLGYRVPLKKYALAFSAGYSGKHYQREYEIYGPCGILGPCPAYKQKFDYQLRRLTIKAGWMF